jgi:hypothetical protein
MFVDPPVTFLACLGTIEGLAAQAGAQPLARAQLSFLAHAASLDSGVPRDGPHLLVLSRCEAVPLMGSPMSLLALSRTVGLVKASSTPT